ncbi:MAG: hypothetical protein LHV68_04750 [Elusimicrobia bacterium]|nr:hypothetical protein [Candidatus Liberimonas magnetica]
MVEDAWDWVQEELQKIQTEMPVDSEMMQVVDAISVADFWKRRYDEEQMLWQRKLETKEDEKKSLQTQTQNHEMLIKELSWQLKNLENRWEQEKLLLEDRLKTKEIETSLDKARFQWETKFESLEKENKDLKSQLSEVSGISVLPAGKAVQEHIDIRVQNEAVKEAEEKIKARLEKIEAEKAEVAKALQEKEIYLAVEKERWQKVEKELSQMSSFMDNRLKSLKDREKEHFVILEDLARGFAHRVRNYLGIMSGTIQLCISNYKMEDEMEEQLKIVDTNVQDMLGSIEEFLKFARIPEMSIKKLDINELLEENLQSFENKFKIQNVSIKKEFGTKINVFDGDKNLLNEAVGYLLQNSLEAMPEGGQLTLFTNFDENNEMITAKIADTGTGISETHIKKIFQPYFSTKKGRKGLSLTAAKRIINLHKGTLQIESVKGKGTTVVINLFIEPKKESLPLEKKA